MVHAARYLILAVMMIVAVTASVQAAEFKVAVLDSLKILETTAEGKKMTEALNEYIASRQKVLNSNEEDIKNLGDELNALGAMLSPQAKEEKENTARRKIAAYQQQTQQFTQETEEKKRALLLGFNQRLEDVVRGMAEKTGFSLVMDKAGRGAGTLIVYTSATDITDQVIKEFDKLSK